MEQISTLIKANKLYDWHEAAPPQQGSNFVVLELIQGHYWKLVIYSIFIDYRWKLGTFTHIKETSLVYHELDYQEHL